jgi:hypothetical protein
MARKRKPKKSNPVERQAQPAGSTHEQAATTASASDAPRTRRIFTYALARD